MSKEHLCHFKTRCHICRSGQNFMWCHAVEKPLKGIKKFPNGFVIENVSMGDPAGKIAKGGKKVVVKYIGKLAKTGKIFDQTKGNKTFTFRLGVGEVIRGWDATLTQDGLLEFLASKHLQKEGQATDFSGSASLLELSAAVTLLHLHSESQKAFLILKAWMVWSVDAKNRSSHQNPMPATPICLSND